MVLGQSLKLTRPWLIHAQKGISSCYVKLFRIVDLFIDLPIQLMFIEYIYYIFSNGEAIWLRQI